MPLVVLCRLCRDYVHRCLADWMSVACSVFRTLHFASTCVALHFLQKCMRDSCSPVFKLFKVVCTLLPCKVGWPHMYSCVECAGHCIRHVGELNVCTCLYKAAVATALLLKRISHIQTFIYLQQWRIDTMIVVHGVFNSVQTWADCVEYWNSGLSASWI